MADKPRTLTVKERHQREADRMDDVFRRANERLVNTQEEKKDDKHKD